MKRFCDYLWSSGLLLGLCACQHPDVSAPREEAKDAESVFVELSVAFTDGSGTRSATDTPDDEGYVTSDDGTEPGKASETAISELLLVLADAENRNIAAGLLEEARSESETESRYVVAVPFRFVKDHTGEEVSVYLFCNPTDEMKSLAKNTPEGALPTEFIDKIYTLADPADDRAWREGAFLMSNARKYVTTLPEKWSDYRSLSSPFPLLGDRTLEVERSVARFDYKTVKTDNRYPVSIDRDRIDQTENPGIEIQLTQAAVVNVNRSFYYLRRVGDEHLTNIEICGTETSENYVLDPFAADKVNGAAGWASKADHYLYNLEAPDSWEWTQLSSLAQTEEDSEWGGNTEETKGYHIWRYVTENAAPDRASQVESISTGIVFKGRIVPGADCEAEMAELLRAGEEPVYVYGNRLYGSWSMVERAAATNEDLRVAWEAVEKNGASLEEAHFTRYTPVNGEYVNYYFYWTVHNDNGVTDPEDPDYLSPMKFAVVRNNVYKLAVEALFGFGATDPEPPDKPEEDPDTYMLVTVKILPWVERSFEITIEE